MVVTRAHSQNGTNTQMPNSINGKTTTPKQSSDKDSLSPEEKKVLRTVFLSLVIDLLAFTVILPLLPSLLDYYGTKEDSLYQYLKDSVTGFRELVGAPDTPRWNSVLFGGLIGSLFSLLQFIASPVIGAASDVYGRKPLLVVSMAGVALSYAIWAVSHNFGLFVIARIIGGISKGNISLSTAVVADILPPRRRGKGMAVIGVAFSVGFVFGPLIGAIFSRWAREHQGEFYVYPALFALVLAVADVIYVAAVFKETLPESKRAKTISSGWQNTSYLINPVSLFRFSSVNKLAVTELQDVRKVGTVYFIYLFLYSGLEFTLTFLTHNRLDYDSMQQGKMFFFIGFIMAAVQGGYVRRASAGKEKKIATIESALNERTGSLRASDLLSDKSVVQEKELVEQESKQKLTEGGMAILIPSFIVMAFAWSALALYISLALFSFASATVVPCLTTMISMYGGDDQKGTIMGVFRSLGALARALGPVAASTVYWSFGSEVCYITGGVLLVIPYLMLKQAGKDKQH